MKPERWGKIESIFHKALEAEESRRAAVLEESCAGDEELRREVESLLAHHAEAGSFIEKPAFADPDASLLRPHNSRSFKSRVGLGRNRDRPLSRSGQDRRWRHGRGLRSRRPEARPTCCPEVSSRRTRRRRAVA